MFIHDSLKGHNVIKRKGIIKEVLLPIENLLSSDITIKLGSEQIEFRDGNSIFVIDKEIGIKEELHTTIFIANDYLICEILMGSIYIRDKDKIYSITDTGTRKLIKSSELDIKWLNVDSYIDYITPLISARYNLDKHKGLIINYIENLSIDVLLNNPILIFEKDGRTDETYTFKLKLLQDYKNFGLDKFEFKVYDKAEITYIKPDNTDNYKLWKKEKEKQKEKEKREKISERKAEQAYLSLRDGEDIVDFDEEEMTKFKTLSKVSFDNFDLDEELDEDDDNYLDDEDII